MCYGVYVGYLTVPKYRRYRTSVVMATVCRHFLAARREKQLANNKRLTRKIRVFACSDNPEDILFPPFTQASSDAYITLDSYLKDFCERRFLRGFLCSPIDLLTHG